jgi:hypothetical protein
MYIKLDIKCPCCEIETELTVPKEAEGRPLLFECVSCSTDLINYQGETYEVDKDELESMKESEVGKVNGFVSDKEEEEENMFSSEMDIEVELEEDLVEELSGNDEEEDRPPINNLDIKYLKLMLDKSEDVLDFVKNIE